VALARVTPRALQDLREAVIALGLPPDTGARVARRLRGPEMFPRLGPALTGRAGLRYLIGPFPG
jgi:hypothetical protein